MAAMPNKSGSQGNGGKPPPNKVAGAPGASRISGGVTQKKCSDTARPLKSGSKGA